MAFKSKKQRDKFHQLVKDEKMSQDTLDKWEKETVLLGADLPERAQWKKGEKPKVLRAQKTYKVKP